MGNELNRAISCIAIDDEPIALDIIKVHASKIPYLNFLSGFNSGMEALSFVRANQVDLIFIDIEMPDLSGLEMAKLLIDSNCNALLIFTTAYSDYAVQGFDLAAVDYLLKPIQFNRFFQACDRVNQRFNSYKDVPSARASTYMFVKSGYEWERINLEELLYVETEDNYLTFHERGKRTLTRMTLTEALKRLPEGGYVQIHKSFAVAIARIDKVERHQIILAGHTLPLSANFRSNILKSLSN